MRPGLALSLLAALVTAASLCNRSLRGHRRQAPPLPPSPVRRLLTAEEAVRLSGGRAVAESLIAADWRLSPEEAARIAMAWPAYTPLVSTRLQ
ncbi:hypothetical protein ASF33_19080 [Methylobacterium sp. Leaf92]|nr:hypothetical protein ASF33_19080 [Methylobacterium sp. Leaf92]